MKFLGFDLFLSLGLYGQRPRFHFDAYMSEPRWYFIEFGNWTLEVTVPKLF